MSQAYYYARAAQVPPKMRRLFIPKKWYRLGSPYASRATLTGRTTILSGQIKGEDGITRELLMRSCPYLYGGNWEIRRMEVVQ